MKTGINLPKLLHKCLKCNRYTLRGDKCPICGGPLTSAHPPKFSPEDKYGEYRRILKKQVEGELSAR